MGHGTDAQCKQWDSTILSEPSNLVVSDVNGTGVHYKEYVSTIIQITTNQLINLLVSGVYGTQAVGQHNFPHHYQPPDLLVSGVNRTGVYCKESDTGLVFIAKSVTWKWCPLQRA